MTTWLPISTAPRDKTYVLVAGDSGYTTTPLRVEVCRYDSDFRPLNPWVNHSDDSFTDGGNPPRWWMPLPPVPADLMDDDHFDMMNRARINQSLPPEYLEAILRAAKSQEML